jgi:xylan 1,4-beta-xylosidase
VSKLTYFCDLAEPTTPFPHFWEHTVGSDHARVALRADWQQQLKRAHDELGFRHVRFHGLLSDDLGTVVRDDKKLLYSFFNSDQIFDYLLSIGMRPFVELSFMPAACFGHENRLQL